MKEICGTVGFFVAAMLMLRFVYGAWPPSEGNLGNWMFSEPKAMWAMVAAIIAGMVGAFVGRNFPRILNEQEGKISSASEYAKRGLYYHEQMKLQESIDMFKRAIETYTELGRIDDAAPVYGSLGKVYFDKGDLDLAEGALQQALTIYRYRSDAQEAITTITALLDLISERRQSCDEPSAYTNAEYGFSLIIPAGWLKQKLVRQFSTTGGLIAISQKTYRATFNVSVGSPDRPEWSGKEARASAIREFLANAPGRIGSIATTTSIAVGGESNTVSAEYQAETDIHGVTRRRRDGLISIVHNGLEYALQWSAERDFEEQVKGIIDSFKFEP